MAACRPSNSTCPAVITATDLRLNEPQLRLMPNIMKAKKKPIDVKEAELSAYPASISRRT